MIHYTLAPRRRWRRPQPTTRAHRPDTGTAHDAPVADIVRTARNAGVQAKLKLSQPADRHEREADKVADQVVAGGQKATAWAAGLSPVGDQTQRMCEGSEEEEEHLQRKRNQAGDGPAAGGAVSSPLAGLSGPGKSLSNGDRGFFESRMGADFSGVRIHTGSDADRMARSINARAFTYRNHIGFAAGEYNTTGSDGRHLVAHELAHVLQQSAGIGDVVSRDECSPRNAGQCCRDAKSGNLDNGNAGGVVCCDGRKVACNWHWLPDGEPNDFIERIIETCITEHEVSHFDDIDDCGATCPSLTRPNFRAGADQGAEECTAYRIELACLRRSLPLCDSLENDAHKRQCRDVIQNTWITDRIRQVNTRCT